MNATDDPQTEPDEGVDEASHVTLTSDELAIAELREADPPAEVAIVSADALVVPFVLGSRRGEPRRPR
jgi:hypothetical protein